MEPRNEKKEPKTPQAPGERQMPRLQIVRLEERIAPKITSNHNETLVRDPAPARPQVPQPCKGDARGRIRLVKLEERIAPKIVSNHNETLVRCRASRAR